MPVNGAYLGAWVSGGDDGWSRAAVQHREEELGRRLAIDHRYHHWDADFPDAHDVWDRRHGRLPLITWEPWDAELEDIVAGHHDQLIRRRARAVAAFGEPLLLRWAHEMNGDWYPWSGAANGGAGDGPALYRKAHRHIHRIFADEAADNVVWVWCPNWVSTPDEPWNHFTRYYPGDRYVDWVCVDGYNRSRHDPRPVEIVLKPIHEEYGAEKPIIIGETGSVEGDEPGVKARWIEDLRSTLPERFPSVIAVVWFDMDKRGKNWRFDSSPSSFEAARDLARDPYFGARPAGARGDDDVGRTSSSTGGAG